MIDRTEPLHTLADRFGESVRWAEWEALVAPRGITLDRSQGTAHPRFPSVIYPLDYGYIPGTLSSDGEPVDVFVGSAPSAPSRDLVGAILTRDHRQGKREAKLLWRCTPEEIYRAHGFINFDRRLLEGALALRWPLAKLWEWHNG